MSPWEAMRRIADYFLRYAGYRIHGYELSRETGVRSGKLYPILAQFEREGWVTSAWERGVVGARRRYYKLTPKGAEVLKKWRAAA